MVDEVQQRKMNQRFQDRNEWQEDPDFRDWLCPVPEQPAYAHCLHCNRVFFAKLQIVKNNSGSNKHQQRAQNQHLNGGDGNNDHNVEFDNLRDIVMIAKKHLNKLYHI